MTDPVRVFALSPLDLGPEPRRDTVGVEPADIVALVCQHLESAGLKLRVSPDDLGAAARQASKLLDVLVAGSDSPIAAGLEGMGDASTEVRLRRA